MPTAVIILLGISALGLMFTIPALIMLGALQNGASRKRPTVVALLLWSIASLGLLGVWFVVTVAAHKVDDSLTNSWLIANATYPIVGILIVRIHRRVMSRQAHEGLAGDS
jgi:hypothetical protein